MEIFNAHIPGVDQWKTTLTRSFFLLLLLLLMVLTWRMKTIEKHISGATQRSLAFTRWTWATLTEPGLQSSHLSIIHRCLNYLTSNEYDGAFKVKHSNLQMKESMYFSFLFYNSSWFPSDRCKQWLRRGHWSMLRNMINLWNLLQKTAINKCLTNKQVTDKQLSIW